MVLKKIFVQTYIYTFQHWVGERWKAGGAGAEVRCKAACPGSMKSRQVKASLKAQRAQDLFWFIWLRAEFDLQGLQELWKN